MTTQTKRTPARTRQTPRQAAAASQEGTPQGNPQGPPQGKTAASKAEAPKTQAPKTQAPKTEAQGTQARATPAPTATPPHRQNLPAQNGSATPPAVQGQAATTPATPAPATTTQATPTQADTRANAPAEATSTETPPDDTAPAEGADEAPGGLPDSGPVAELLSVMTDMTLLLTEEVQALKRRDPATIKDLQQRKEYLGSAYETHVKTLKADPALLDALDDDARAELHAATESFHDALRRNGRALAAAHDVAQELLTKTVDFVKDHRRTVGGYSPAGVPRGERERYATPAALDQNL